MTKLKVASLASIFDDDPAQAAPSPEQTEYIGVDTDLSDPVEVEGGLPKRVAARRALPPEVVAPGAVSARKDSHPGKKPVLIHIPEDMHRTLRMLSVEDGGEPITKVVERSLRDYLVRRGHTKYGKVS